MIILFVLGPPGAGKTSAVRLLLEKDSSLIPKPKWTVGRSIVAAGHYTGQTFDGADSVPYNGVKDAMSYWEQYLVNKQVTILDGDRFSYNTAKEWFARLADRTCAVYLRADQEALDRRRAERGSSQNPTWMKGRLTKATRFFEGFDDAKVINANHGVASVADDIRKFVWPSF